MFFLKNATYIDSETFEIRNTHIAIQKGKNKDILFVNEIPKNATVLDVSGKIVTQSFACGHHHAYSALARGMDAPPKIPKNFYQILKYVWWNLDKSLDKNMIKASALATAVAAAKAGVTFVIDHHASPFALKDSLSIIAEAFEKVGVSHLLCYEISDRDGLEITNLGLEESQAYLEKKQALIGLHASFTVGNQTLRKAVKLAEQYDSGIHIHVAEDKYDQAYTLRKHKTRVIERLSAFGVLNFNKTILAHCLHLSDNERKIISKSKAWVVENIESNLNNKVGFFDGQKLEKQIFLGTDGMHSDMIKSTQAAFFIGQNFENINQQLIYKRLRNVHKYLNINNFEGDSTNNLIVLDYKSPTPVTKQNFLGHFFYGFSSKDIQHVISDGKLIVKDFEIQTVDEKEIFEFSKKEAEKLWSEMQNFKF